MQSDIRLQFKSPFLEGVLSGDGTIFIDTKAKKFINFDTEFTTQTGDTILPSFLLADGKQVFFDVAEQKDVIFPDLWSLYTTLLRRDEGRALGNVTKKDVDTLIRSLLAREPESSDGIVHHDLRVRNSLEEVSTLVNKIEK